MPFFAVKKGRVPGIYTNWSDCKEQIDNFPNSWFKKFRTEIEADRCMKSRRSIVINDSDKKYKIQDIKGQTLSPGDIELLKIQVEIIREKIARCITLFSKKLFSLSKRLDMVEYDINTASQDPRYDANPKYLPPSDYGNGTNSSQDNWSNFLNDNHSQYNNSINKTWNYPLDTRYRFVPPLIQDKDGFIDVYIDGAVKNSGTEYARGGIGVWFNNGHPLNIADALEGDPTTINAEIQAARRAIQQAAAAGLTKLNIHTDSTHMIYSITIWINFWRKNNWRTALGCPVKIRDEIEKLEEAVHSMEAIKWTYIRSHQGNEGNENADILAHTGVAMNGQKRFYSYHFPEELKQNQINN